jgi:esterase/lipase superfamily enzyme
MNQHPPAVAVVRGHRSTALHSLMMAVLLASLLAGCGRTLMPVPEIYRTGGAVPFVDLAPELEGDLVSVPFVTDRLPSEDSAKAGGLAYGSERSESAALGLARVRLPENSMESIASSLQGGQRIRVESVAESVRFPATPYRFDVDPQGAIRPSAEVTAELREATARAREVINGHLALIPRKEVIVLVHGVGTTFDDAVLSTAEMWHFLGRELLTIAYTWPAGNSGLFFYTADRESGEFTVLHLKQFLRILAAIPEIERIHIAAHSRGTDIATSALRELALEVRGAGENAREVLKIDNVVLLAADLDLDVAMQRLVGEALGPAVGCFTVYVNKNDQALAAAKALFNSRQRLGALNKQKLTDEQRAILYRIANLDIVAFRRGRAGMFNHGYFRDPHVSSDIAALLRYRDKPGEGARRELERVSGNIWRL